MNDGTHVSDLCLDDAAVYVLKAALVDTLLASRSICPACVSQLLRELAAESDSLWRETDPPPVTCRH